MSCSVIDLESGRKVTTTCPGKDVLLDLITINNWMKLLLLWSTYFHQVRLESYNQTQAKEIKGFFSLILCTCQETFIPMTRSIAFTYDQLSVLVSKRNHKRNTAFCVSNTWKAHKTKMTSCLSFYTLMGHK
jgi:hypothetical protein